MVSISPSTVTNLATVSAVNPNSIASSVTTVTGVTGLTMDMSGSLVEQDSIVTPRKRPLSELSINTCVQIAQDQDGIEQKLGLSTNSVGGGVSLDRQLSSATPMISTTWSSSESSDFSSPPVPAAKKRKEADKKSNEEVWPPEVEEAFFDALRVIPKLGRRKVMVNGKPCGRNELIADYIYKKTKKLRTRKQVSSHIQVLKNMKKDDPVFMALISEPSSEDDCFKMQSLTYDDDSMYSHQSPIDEIFVNPFMPQPMVVAPPMSRGAPSLLTQFSRVASTPTVPTPSAPIQIQTLPTTGIPIQRSSNTNLQLPCSVMPVGFTMTGTMSEIDINGSTVSSHQHSFLRMDMGATTTTTTSTSPIMPLAILEDLPNLLVKFPGLSGLYASNSCPFVHIKCNLDFPQFNQNQNQSLCKISSIMEIMSSSSSTIECITTIRSYGTQVLTVQQSAVATTSDSVTSSFKYRLPFASEFWSAFVQGLISKQSTLSSQMDWKAPINGVSVMQVFKNAPDGEMLLVMTYDFSSSDITNSGIATPSLLCSRRECEITPNRTISNFGVEDVFSPVNNEAATLAAAVAVSQVFGKPSENASSTAGNAAQTNVIDLDMSSLMGSDSWPFL